MEVSCLLRNHTGLASVRAEGSGDSGTEGIRGHVAFVVSLRVGRASDSIERILVQRRAEVKHSGAERPS